MSNQMVNAEYVMNALDVSKNTAYRIIRALNAELEGSGVRTIAGRVSLAYFEAKYFAVPDEKGVRHGD